MKSLCIKTNSSQIIHYLLKSFENINLEDTYISERAFKHFHNVIVHHQGSEHSIFLDNLANTISKIVITYYESDFIKTQITLNYFYFHAYEKKQILENVLRLLEDSTLALKRYQIIYLKALYILESSHSFYLQSFINFSLKEYSQLLNEQIEIAVNQYLINKEYIEFVHILRLYIQSESANSKIEHLHLIYQNKNSIIIDDDKNIIACNDNLKKAKYISDISFSSNDFALNTLLNLIPQKITIHLVDGLCDEFINTLKLIFQDQVQICEDCDICNLYKRKEFKQ